MIMYERNRFGDLKDISIFESKKSEYNIPHFHRSFELLYIINGDITVHIDDKAVNLKTDEFVLIYPNQIHSFTENVQTISKLVIFSPDLISDFYYNYKNKKPLNIVKNLDENTKAQIVENLTYSSDKYLIKSTLYAICSFVCKNTSFYESTNKSDQSLNHKLLCFIEENFEHECTLDILAKKFGYSYEYLSWYFTKQLGVSFVEILNSYRTSKAAYLLKNDTSNIADIAYICGFNNIRSFNRNFKRHYYSKPSEYRKQ